MANWITLKQLSEKRGIAESDLRTWANLGYHFIEDRERPND